MLQHNIKCIYLKQSWYNKLHDIKIIKLFADILSAHSKLYIIYDVYVLDLRN